jgi:hypothetical protein
MCVSEPPRYLFLQHLNVIFRLSFVGSEVSPLWCWCQREQQTAVMVRQRKKARMESKSSSSEAPTLLEQLQATNERMARMEEEIQAAKQETQRLRESLVERNACPESVSCLSLSFICSSCQEFHGFPWLLRRPLPRRMLSSRTILSSHQPLTF